VRFIVYEAITAMNSEPCSSISRLQRIVNTNDISILCENFLKMILGHCSREVSYVYSSQEMLDLERIVSIGIIISFPFRAGVP